MKIKSKLLLRIGAVIMLLHSIGHTVGFSGWQKPGGVVPSEVITMMQEKHFEVRGQDTTMAASFTGSGYTVSLFLLLIVCLLWHSSSRANKSNSGFISIMAVTLFLLALVEFVFYFPAVAILSLTASVLVWVALIITNRTVQVQ